MYPYGSFPNFAAAGAMHVFRDNHESPFTALKDFYSQHQDWMVGFLGYDLKNFTEKLSSRNIDRIGFPDLYFFIPETLVSINPCHIEISSVHDPRKIWEEINETKIRSRQIKVGPVSCDTPKDLYLNNVGYIKDRILDGDFYELNYCLEYFAENVRLHPPVTYLHLNRISPMPMSVMQGFSGHYLMSASPERFLKKSGDLLIAQPMKGTIRRSPDPVEDKKLKAQLRRNKKELAENMMIVDLMRNDLGKSAVPGSVNVSEIFGVYSFSHLHQMISTVTCRLRKDIHPVDAIMNAFPMGSMTGAPKIRVMQEIEYCETGKRGPFSGASGYFSPVGDFDFNVLIRSIFYNRNSRKLKFNAGSAITSDSKPLDEYEECRLKAAAIMEALAIS